MLDRWDWIAFTRQGLFVHYYLEESRGGLKTQKTCWGLLRYIRITIGSESDQGYILVSYNDRRYIDLLRVLLAVWGNNILMTSFDNLLVVDLCPPMEVFVWYHLWLSEIHIFEIVHQWKLLFFILFMTFGNLYFWNTRLFIMDCRNLQ